MGKSEKLNSKKIAIVANTSWNIYNFRVNVVKKLLDHGYTIEIISPIDQYTRQLKKITNSNHNSLIQLKRKGINPLNDLRFLFELYFKYRNLKPDLTNGN